MAALLVLNSKAADRKFSSVLDLFNAVPTDTRVYDGCIKVDVYEYECAPMATLAEE